MRFSSLSLFVSVLLVASVIVCAAPARAADLWVKPGGGGGYYNSIGKALSAAVSGDKIHVLAGTYDSSVETFPLEMKDGVSLTGSGPGRSIIDAEHSARVINIIDVSNVTIEGFTITGGYVTGSGAYDFANGNGGGIYCYNSTEVLIKDCEICDNYAKGTFASKDGRGQRYYWGNYDPPALAGGGGLYLRYSKKGSSPTITIENCTIHDNQTGMGGGGICSNYAPALIRDCCISDNIASRGGGVYWFDYILGNEGDAKIEHILFNDLIIGNQLEKGERDKNWSDGQGGGVYISSWGIQQRMRIYSTTIADNEGYALYISHNCENVDFKGANDIIWTESDDYSNEKSIYDDGFNQGLDISYSDIQWKDCTDNIYDGNGHNININPEFEHYSEEVACERYFLDQDLANGPVDSGDDSAYNASLLVNSSYTTCTDGRKDTSPVDMGYHYKRYGCSYIDLVSFEARPSEDGIILSWQTGTEIDNAGFVIYRTEGESGEYELISGLIEPKGSAASGASYTFTDTDVRAGITYYYWLVDIDTSGKWTAHGPVSARLLIIPRPFMLPRTERVMVR